MKQPVLKITIEYGDEHVERVITGLRGRSLYEFEWTPYSGLAAEDEMGAVLRELILMELNEGKSMWMDYTADGKPVENTYPLYHGLWALCVELCHRIRIRADGM
jgi:hypothetical protein